MAEYYVVLGDVVKSREIEDREAFQKRLAETCAQFTARRRDDVYGDFKILKGVDEFGGVLQSLENLYDIVTKFQDSLHPHGVRIAVASGSIDVGLTTFDIEKMDGKAFHRASQRLEALEDDPLVFDLLIDDGRLGRAVADEINLLLDRRRQWTDRQREVIRIREEEDTQSAAAQQLDVTQQAVSNVLSGANWQFVNVIEGRLRETLEEYAESRPDAEIAGDNLSFEHVERAMEANHHTEALDHLEELLNESITAGYSDELIEAIRPRLDDVIDPLLANATDVETARSVLSLLEQLAVRTTGPASEDVRLWSYVEFMRRGDVPLAVWTSGPEIQVAKDYSTGIGLLLAEKPSKAFRFFESAWKDRDDVQGWERDFALAAGAALLGCSEPFEGLIPSAKPTDREEIGQKNTLRTPAKRFLESFDDDSITPEEITEAVHDDELEQFSKLEAEAFARLRSQIDQKNE